MNLDDVVAAIDRLTAAVQQFATPLPPEPIEAPPCPRCNGQGQFAPGVACTACGGSGYGMGV